MSRALPRHDPYAAHRCSCSHICAWHQDGRCLAGDHLNRPCTCAGFAGDCTCPPRRDGTA